MAYNQEYSFTGPMSTVGQVLQQNTSTPQVQVAGTLAEIDAQPNLRPPVRPFDPTDHDLDANFRLTRFADLKG